MRLGADRDVFEFHAGANLYRGTISYKHRVSRFHILWRKNIAFIAVTERNKSNKCRAIGIVLKRRNGSGNIKLCLPKIHRAQQALGTPSTKTRGNSALRIPAASPLF